MQRLSRSLYIGFDDKLLLGSEISHNVCIQSFTHLLPIFQNIDYN